MAQNIQYIQIPKHITRVNTEKTFFKKYSYKICFVIDDRSLKKISHNTGLTYKYWSDRADLRRSLRNKIVALLPANTDYRTREEGMYVSLFVDDDVIASSIIEQMQHCIREVHMPISNEHKSLMHNNHRIRIRPTLFYNKYRYKISIKNGWNDRFKNFNSLEEWLNGLGTDPGEDRWMVNQPLSAVFNTDEDSRNAAKFRYRYSNYAVFLNDEQDVMMLQLWLNEWYEHTEKAVLVTEI